MAGSPGREGCNDKQRDQGAAVDWSPEVPSGPSGEMSSAAMRCNGMSGHWDVGRGLNYSSVPQPFGSHLKLSH
jgi:hypothetical protein